MWARGCKAVAHPLTGKNIWDNSPTHLHGSSCGERSENLIVQLYDYFPEFPQDICNRTQAVVVRFAPSATNCCVERVRVSELRNAKTGSGYKDTPKMAYIFSQSLLCPQNCITNLHEKSCQSFCDAHGPVWNGSQLQIKCNLVQPSWHMLVGHICMSRRVTTLYDAVGNLMSRLWNQRERNNVGKTRNEFVESSVVMMICLVIRTAHSRLFLHDLLRLTARRWNTNYGIFIRHWLQPHFHSVVRIVVFGKYL